MFILSQIKIVLHVNCEYVCVTVCKSVNICVLPCVRV
jgi:hypothetical protein